MMRGLLHRAKHKGIYDWGIQQRCVPPGTRPVRQVHTNMVTGERWMEQIQCNTEPVYLGRLPKVRVEQ